MPRFFGGLMRLVTRSWHIYPIGVLFGFGIVAVFVLAWAVALGVWRFGRIEDRWSGRLAVSGVGSDGGQ
jgi:high-affinity nickel permease